MVLKSKTFIKLKNGRGVKTETGFYNNVKELKTLKNRMKSKGFQ